MSRLLRIKLAVAGVLGHGCSSCGKTGYWRFEKVAQTMTGIGIMLQNGYVPLQVGHPNGRRWSIRRVNTTTRWMRYLREALAGKVRAECGPCNRKHGGGLRYARVDKTRQGGRS